LDADTDTLLRMIGADRGKTARDIGDICQMSAIFDHELAQSIARLRRAYPARSRARWVWRRYGWPLLLVAGAAWAGDIGPPRPPGVSIRVTLLYLAVLAAGGLAGRTAAVVAAGAAAMIITAAYCRQTGELMAVSGLVWLAVHLSVFGAIIFFATQRRYHGRARW
jgi:hypothetical protein